MRRFKWNPFSNMSFRAKLIISNAILASVILIIMAFYLISRATATSDFMAAKLTQAVQDATENELTGNATRFAGELDHFFGSLLSHIETITSALKIEMANEQAYEPINLSSLRHLPQGSWGNSDTEPGSLFISNQDEIPGSILSEIRVIRQIDLIVPSIMETDSDVLAIYYGSVLGEMLYYPNINLASNLPADFDVTAQPWFVEAAPQANPTSKTICSDPYQNASLKPIITCSAPVYDVSNQFRGVIAMDIQLTHVTDLVSVIPVGKTGYAFVIDNQGHVLAMPQRGYADFGFANSDGENLLTESVVKSAPLEFFGAIGWMTNGLRGFRSATVNGVDKYIAFSPIPTMGYSIGLVVPVDEMQGPVLATQARLNIDKRETLIRLVSGSVVALFIFLAAVLWLGTVLTLPITRLTETASLIAEGDIQRVAEVESNDEIGLLARTLNLMTKNLRELINDLEHRVEERTQELQISNINLEQRAQELAAINSVQAAFVTKLDMEAIYEAVGNKLRGIFHQADVGIRIYDPKTDMLHFPFAYENGERINIDPLKMNDKGVVAHIFRTHEPLLINENVKQESEKYGAFTIPGTQQEKSLLMVPLMEGGQVHGILEIVDMEHEHAFNESDLRLLQTLANSMSIALENARLFDETQRLLKETEQRNAELVIVNGISQAMSQRLDMDGIIRIVGDKVRDIFSAEVTEILLLNESTNMIMIPYSFYRSYQEFKPFPFGEGLTSRVIQTRTPIVHNTLKEAVALGTLFQNEADKTESYIGVPIVAGEKALGVISVQSYEQYAFNENHIRLLSTLAANMGVALENARLFDETQRLLKETEQRNAELAIINSVQAALAANLDIQGIYDAVGDKIREIFDAQVVDIGLYDPKEKLVHFPYAIERSVRFPDEPMDLIGFRKHVFETRRYLLINENIVEVAEEYGNPLSIQGEIPKSNLFVPMIVGNETRGVISLQNLDHENAFSESDVSLLTTLVNSMSVALENARLFDETQHLLKETEQRNAELAIINSVQAALAANLNMQGIYDAVGDKIREIFNAQSTFIMFLDKQTNLEHYPYIIEKGNRLVQEPIVHDEKGFGPKALWTRQPVVINQDMLKHMEEVGSYLIGGEELPKSAIYVPMFVGDEPSGVVYVGNVDEENGFTESDVRLLQTLANSMSVALENARLFDETQRLLKQTEQRAAELAVIGMVSQVLVAETDLDSMIQLIGSQMREIFDADIVYIALLDPETNLIHFPYQIGESFTTLKLGEGLTGKIIDTGEPLLFNRDVNARSLEIGAVPVGTEVLSYLGIPIMVGGEPIGVISVQSTTQEGLFDGDSLRLLTTIASNAGAAIHTARLYTETQRLLEETEQRATELQIINNIGQTLTEGLDLNNTLKRVGDRLRETLKVETIGISVWDENIEHIIARYSYHNGKPTSGETWDASGVKMALRLSARGGGRSWVVNKNVEKSWRKFGGLNEVEVPKSFVQLPLLAGGKFVGGITVADYEREDVFTNISIGMLETIASNLGTAIQNARLFEETQHLLKETEQRATELQIINNIGQIITGELDLTALIEHVGDKLRDAYNIGDIRIAVIDEKTGKVIASYLYYHGKRIPFDEFWQNKSAKYKLAMRVSARAGTRSWVVNTDAEKAWRKFNIVIDEQDIPKSFVMLPLLAGREVIGGITIPNYEKENAFTHFSIGMLETIASNMGTAVQNVRLFNETKRLFEEAEESRASAEHANKAKSTFLANMSHELRTPLNAIIGFTRIVRRKSDSALPEKQIENLDKVLSSSEHLLGLINTVLDIAKIEAGRMDVIPAKFSMSSLADQCANLAAPLLKPNVTLEKQVDETIGIIFSDQDKIKQIVLNLLSNAAKFTHEGMILLSVQKLNEEYIKISVADSGIGISEEALGRIFEEFQQADTSTTREYGGTGLGLAISRNLARLLGGDLAAGSELGKGSIFTLTVPIYYGRRPASPSDDETASFQEPTQQPRLDSGKHRVLVIDDDPDALYLLQEGLDTNEFDVIGARNGQTGLQIAREQQPAAILLDILMPETDGWQILNDLKSDAATANIPVILLTIVDKKALGFKLGATDYLLKPLNPTAVLDALNRVFEENDRTRKCVLVVDDDPNVAEMLRQTLPETEFELESAEDGEAGLRAVRMRPPDLILLDLMMPKLDGFGVIENLRVDSELRDIPIIVISAKELTLDESKKLRESVAFVMKKQGLDGSRLIQEINRAVAENI